MISINSTCFWILILVGSFVVQPSASADSLLANGSFEDPGFTGPPYYQYLNNGDTSIAHWTATYDGIGERSYWTSSGGYGVYDGQHAVVLNSGDTLTNTFATVAGQTYNLTFYGVADNDPTRHLLVTAGDQSHTFAQNDGADTGVYVGKDTSGNPENWRKYTYSFTSSVTNPTATFQFNTIETGATFGGFELDDASITAAPLPSPLGGGFCLLGVLGATILWRRRPLANRFIESALR